MKDTEVPSREQQQFLKPQLDRYADKRTCGQPPTSEEKDYPPDTHTHTLGKGAVSFGNHKLEEKGETTWWISENVAHLWPTLAHICYLPLSS